MRQALADGHIVNVLQHYCTMEATPAGTRPRIVTPIMQARVELCKLGATPSGHLDKVKADCHKLLALLTEPGASEYAPGEVKCFVTHGGPGVPSLHSRSERMRCSAMGTPCC